MLHISNIVTIPDAEIEITAIRSQGSGGQNVNKVSTAIHLRFDITASSLPDCYKERLLALTDHRITKGGDYQLQIPGIEKSGREQALGAGAAQGTHQKRHGGAKKA